QLPIIYAIITHHRSVHSFPTRRSSDLHVRAREHRRGQAHERRQRHQRHAESVHVKPGPGDDAVRRHLPSQPRGARQAQCRCPHVDSRGEVPGPQERKHPGRNNGNEQHHKKRVHGDSSSRSCSRLSRSTSNESMLAWISRKKTPNRTMATRTSKAIPSSTTSGMPPVADTAARNRPFSMDMKPMTWLTACWRNTIINTPMSTTARLIATMLRVIPLS